MKMLVMFGKDQQFENSRNEETKLRESKHLLLYSFGNELEYRLEEKKSNNVDNSYVSLPFIPYFYPQKELTTLQILAEYQGA